MKDFKDRIKLSPSQRNEVERYLGTVGVLNEYAILKLEYVNYYNSHFRFRPERIPQRV